MTEKNLDQEVFKCIAEADEVLIEGAKIAERLCAIIAPCSDDPEAFHWDLLGLDTAADLKRGFQTVLDWPASLREGSLGVLLKEFPDGLAGAKQRLEKLRRIVAAAEAVE